MPKLSQHMVEGIFKDAGCELLDTYQDARTKVTYRCSFGYTSQELQAHLACFPNFEQLQRGDWHLDHIFPIKAFVEHGITELGFINALDNLQPLSKEANCGKNDAYDEDAFISYCIRHGLNVQRRKVQ